MGCAYCGVEFSRKNNRPTSASVDHIVPRSKLDAHNEGEAWHRLNRIRVCRDCNSRKGDMYPLDYLVMVPDYGVRTLAMRLVELGCDVASINAALKARRLAIKAVTTYVRSYYDGVE